MIFSVRKTKKLSQESIDRMIEKGFTETEQGFYIRLTDIGKKQNRQVSRQVNRYEPSPIETPQLV